MWHLHNNQSGIWNSLFSIELEVYILHLFDLRIQTYFFLQIFLINFSVSVTRKSYQTISLN